MRKPRRSGIPSPAVPALWLLIILLASPGGAAELKNRLFTGYDSFIDRYTLLEDDTTETVPDFYLGLDNMLLAGRGPSMATLRNIFRFGNQTIDDDISGVINAGSREGWLMQLRGELRLKYFREGSDYAFGNDYAQSNINLKLGWRLAETWYITSKTRAETLDFRDRTIFDYDYRYLDTGLGIEGGSYFGRYLSASAALGRRVAPDTTDLSFDRFVSDVEARLSSGPLSLDITTFIDRRGYDGAGRSDYWFIYTTGTLSWTGTGGTEVGVRAESEILDYDRQSRTWFDNQFLRGSLLVRTPVAGISHVYVEPRIAALRCESFIEERYREWTAVLGIDVTGSDRFWLSLSWEPGYRDYTLDDNPVYSDFRINRFSLMASGNYRERYGADLMISHDPEKHTRRTDDFTITMISIVLSMKF